MGTAERRERHRSSLRREILEAASRLFVEEGYRGVTMRRIARRIEYSPTTIYLYFRNKSELLAAVCEETFSQLAVKLERLHQSAPTPLGYVREALRTYVDFGLAHPDQYTVTFMAPSSGLEGQDSAHTAASRAFDMLGRGVAACAESGDILAPNVDMTAQALWAAVHGMTSLLITQRGFPFAAKPILVDHLVDSLIAGLKTPAVPPRSPVSAQSKKWNYFD